MLQSCDQSAGCRDTERVHGATIAHCSACFHCNTTSNSHTVWGRRLVVTRSEDRSGMTQHRSLQRRIWPNTCLHPAGPHNLQISPVHFHGLFQAFRDCLPSLTLKTEMEVEEIQSSQKRLNNHEYTCPSSGPFLYPTDQYGFHRHTGVFAAKRNAAKITVLFVEETHKPGILL